MAGRNTNRYRSTHTERQMYVYGNTVAKPAYEPKRLEPVREQPKKTSGQVKRNRKKALRVSRGYVAFMAAAAILALAVCVNYVQLQSQLTSRSKNITALQEELASAKEENTTRYNAVMDSVNLEQVREKAMNELNMVYADSNQIIEYDNPSGDYVKQYENIPESGVVASAKDIQN